MDKNASLPMEVFGNATEFTDLVDRVFMWGIDRNITAQGGATALSQIKKLKEEVQEIEDALLKGDVREAKDGIGDSQVVLLQICRLLGVDLVDCLAAAWSEIKDRKGKMVDGVFVKELK